MENMENSDIKPESDSVETLADLFFKPFFVDGSSSSGERHKTKEQLEDMADKMIANEQLREAVIKFYNESYGTSGTSPRRPGVMFDSEAMESEVERLEKIIKKKSKGKINLRLKHTPAEEW